MNEKLGCLAPMLAIGAACLVGGRGCSEIQSNPSPSQKESYDTVKGVPVSVASHHDSDGRYDRTCHLAVVTRGKSGFCRNTYFRTDEKTGVKLDAAIQAEIDDGDNDEISLTFRSDGRYNNAFVADYL